MLALVAATPLAYLNLHGGPLERCSGPGMALTGFTRTGQCVDQQDDAGSHHVCLDLQSDDSGSFCEMTGQSNWCESRMPCDTGNSAADGWSKGAPGECAVQHWCVCQWEFASYLQSAGGCEHIKTIVCEATNIEAYLAYRKPESAADPHIAEALRCLEQRCGLPSGDGAHVAEGAACTWRRGSPARYAPRLSADDAPTGGDGARRRLAPGVRAVAADGLRPS